MAVVLNKVDLGVRVNLEELRKLTGGVPTFRTSALSGEGIDALKRGLFDYILSHGFVPGKDAVAINSRHRECLLRAKGSILQAIDGLRNRVPADFVTIDVKGAVIALGEVTGELVSEEVVNTIFDQFCVGK